MTGAKSLRVPVVVTALALLAAFAPASAWAASSVRVKFTDESGVRLKGPRFTAPAGTDVTAVNAVLDRYVVAKARRLFVRSELTLGRDRVHLAKASGRKLRDLNAYFVIPCAPEQVAALVGELAALAVVETVYAEPRVVRPPATPDLTSGQGYKSAAPGGIGTTTVAGTPGADGSRVRVLDIEYSWNRAHEDITKLAASSALINNGTPVDPFADTNHGTATMGELVADVNATGISGLVPGATPRLVNAFNSERGYDLANAIMLGRSNLSAGDVMMIEQQASGPAGGGDYVPVEWIPEVYDAISFATAAGIIVVEAAGNGGVDLDAPGSAQPFPSGRPDSRAIIVGAGAAPGCGSPARSRLSFSTFGSRVNLQGWGECVTTSGYGNLFGTTSNAFYTNSFNGTSSATPIVSAAAAALSSAAIARDGRPLAPAQMRDILQSTGSAQDTTSSGVQPGRIGPQPNLVEAFKRIGAPADPSNLVANPSFEDGTAGWGSFQGKLTRTALAGAPNGAYVGTASWVSGTLYSISDEQSGATPTVASSIAGSTYVATANVKAATASVGKPVQIFLRERTSSGTVVKETSTRATLGASFARIGVAATGVGTGNTIGLRIVQNAAGPGDAFHADLITLRKATTLMGSTQAGTVWTTMSPNAKRATPFQFTSPGTADVSALRAYLDGKAAATGTQRLRAVIYANASGAPGSLVARSNEVSIAAGRAPGWATLSFASPVRLPAGSYWLGLHSGGSTTVARYASASAAGQLRFNDDPYADGAAASFGSAGTDAKRLSIYAIGA